MESLGIDPMPPLKDALRLYFAERDKLLNSARV
jgi:hypothetical protein